MKLFRREVDGEDHYYLFAKHYLPEDTASDPEKQHYLGWVHDGKLIATDGNIIDQNRIKDDIIADAKTFSFQEFAFDPFGSTKLAIELQDDGLPMVEVPQQVRHLSEPMKWLDALILAGRIHHTGDPVLTWMISNVTAKIDANDNVFPRKERPENKIDGVVALIMALGRAMNSDGGSVYESRGILYL